MTGPADALLDELAAAHEKARRAYWTARDHTAEGMTVAEHHRAAGRQAMAAALEVLKRDRCLEAQGHVFHPLSKPSRKPRPIEEAS